MRRFALAGVVMAALWAPAAAAEQGPLPLEVRQARVVFRGTGAADTIVVRGRFARPEALSHYDHDRDAVTLTVGLRTYTVGPSADGIVVRVVGLSKGQRMKYRRPANGPGALRSLAFDLRSGTFSARIDPDDLSSMRADGNWAVAVGLSVGACAFSTAVDLAPKDGASRERWTFRGGRRAAAKPVELRGSYGLDSPPVGAPLEVIVRSEQAWVGLWGQFGGDAGDRPDIDFDEEMVVAVALGTRASSGYLVRINSVVERGGTTHVRYTETAPGRNCVVLTVITHPWVLAKVRRTEGPDAFEARVRRVNCGR